MTTSHGLITVLAARRLHRGPSKGRPSGAGLPARPRPAGARWGHAGNSRDRSVAPRSSVPACRPPLSIRRSAITSARCGPRRAPIIAGARNVAGAHAYLNAWMAVEGPYKFCEDTGSGPVNPLARARMADDSDTRARCSSVFILMRSTPPGYLQRRRGRTGSHNSASRAAILPRDLQRVAIIALINAAAGSSAILIEK